MHYIYNSDIDDGGGWGCIRSKKEIKKGIQYNI